MPHATIRPHRPAPKKTAEDAVLAHEKAADDMTVACQQLRVLQALPLYQLPTELVLQVLYNLDLDDYPAIISATLPLLRRCNIVQNMPTPRLRSLLMENRCGFIGPLSRFVDPESDTYMPPVFRHSIRHRLSPMNTSFWRLSNMPLRLRGDFDKLPYELRTLIIIQLDTLDKINLVLACYRFSDEDIERMTHERI